MITVEINVPYINTSYDFSLDEAAPITTIIEEIAEIICIKERWAESDSYRKLDLFDPVKCKKLDTKKSLSEENIIPGQKLIIC